MDIILSQVSINFIVSFEIISEAYYIKNLSAPIWPGGASGVTIGIGYDLGYNPPAAITADWGDKVDADTLSKLISVSGISGKNALNILGSLSGVDISLDVAKDVFTNRSLKNTAISTMNAFPGFDALQPDAVGALVSLVYNRGDAMTIPNDTRDSRREMRQIRAITQGIDPHDITLDVINQIYPGIADQIESMKRLWDPIKMKGLLVRRDQEAALVRGAFRAYGPDEGVTISW
jgi:hypothetical protein